MPAPLLSVLYEDNHLLLVNKPANLPTIGVGPDEPSLVKLAKSYIKQRFAKPGNVYLGVMSRLDAVVSGVVVLARTSKAAARLTEQFASREVEKTYWAIVSGEMRPAASQCLDWVVKDDRRARMTVVPAGTPGAREARLNYRQLKKLAQGSLLEIDLLTGRKHQIRVQLAARGCPVLGDRKYGGHGSGQVSGPFGPGIALHARRLTLRHPVRDERVEVEAPLPRYWPAESRNLE
jgi:23S rRNA pseudouridine1911/1915/1917 synthase